MSSMLLSLGSCKLRHVFVTGFLNFGFFCFVCPCFTGIAIYITLGPIIMYFFTLGSSSLDGKLSQFVVYHLIRGEISHSVHI